MAFQDKQEEICGYLDLDEEDKRKKFSRRYFVLSKSKGVLEWYTDKPSITNADAQPCGFINLDYITKVDEAKKLKIEFCFVINTPFRPYYVQAKNQVELEKWVEILNDASKIIVPPEAMLRNVAPETVSTLPQSHSVIDLNNDLPNSNCTYRTEIVGNVVRKKKIGGDSKKSFIEDPLSPRSESVGSDFKFSLSPDPTASGSTFFGINDKDIIKRGWGVKQGHVRKNWKRRFFILTKQTFAYYKYDHDKEPIRSIPISEILKARVDDSEISRQRDNLFLIATTDKLYYIQTDSPEEMHSWINAVNDSISNNQTLNNKKHQDNAQAMDFKSTNASLSQQQLKKQTSAVQLTWLQPQSGIRNGASLANVEATGHAQKKRKTHRRAESAVTALPTHALETMPVQISGALPSVAYNAEDVRARPESINFSTLSEQTWNIKSSKSAMADGNMSHQRLRDNPALELATSQVDTRAALKPSAVKKKKNPGILFPFNAMLKKKHDKIEKEKAKIS